MYTRYSGGIAPAYCFPFPGVAACGVQRNDSLNMEITSNVNTRKFDFFMKATNTTDQQGVEKTRNGNFSGCHGKTKLDVIEENVDEASSGYEGSQDDPDDELWDIFRKDRNDEDHFLCKGFNDSFFKVIKIMTYIFLCLVLFSSILASRGSLQILSALYANHQDTGTLTRDVISYLFLFIITIPDAILLLKSSFQFLFGKRDVPTLVHVITVTIREIGHVIGLSAFLFKVLPNLDALKCNVVVTTVPMVIASVHVVSYCGRRNAVIHGWNPRKITKQALNMLFMLTLFSFVITVPILISQNSKMTTSAAEFIAWEIASVVLLSTRWIETYLPRNISKKGCTFPISARSLDNGHVMVCVCSSVCRLIVAIALFATVFSRAVRPIHDTFTSFSKATESVAQLNYVNGDICRTIGNFDKSTNIHSIAYACVRFWDVLGPFVVHILSAMIANYCAVVACRLCMQTISFSLPLATATPIFAILMVVLAETETTTLESKIGLQNIDKSYPQMLAIFIIGWIAQLWFCKHIWTSAGEERLAFTRKLFVLPHFCSPIIDLCMIHSRKRKIAAQTLRKEDANQLTPMVYICATMWHENRTEMKQILTSIFRLDLDQFARGQNKKLGETDYYEFEVDRDGPLFNSYTTDSSELQCNQMLAERFKSRAHIPFDDAMETPKSYPNLRTINDFVRQLMEIVEEAGRSFYKKDVNLIPEKCCTPYGGRLVWILPGQNKLIAHLKDKEKMRHKKRWSQIMYMYYFSGYEMMIKFKDEFKGTIPNFQDMNSVFEGIPEKIKEKAENTYVLALDGDVDFHPEAILLLIDRMKKNSLVGATCGRIKPGGSGPLVWYQRFEYAIGHWLQKSAEHVFGCVLCSPGCFSMFRLKALMDDNVLRKYASLPTEPGHFLQYDQGEDRWLCTLLLQQGYRIEYCAAAEAITFVPEEFKEFFNQRRRWIPSTMANIWDLLQSYSRTTKQNPSISYFYIFYQFVLFFSSVLGPSTVLLAMNSAINSVFSVPSWFAYCLVYVPVVLFVFVCLRLKSNTQLNIAMILSAIYALLMMTVFVGTMVNITTEGWYKPTGLFMYILMGTFLLAGLLHPHEFGDLVWGLFYFVCIPAGYLFLIIYAICNLNNISWGTRETQKAVLESNTSINKINKIKEAEDELGNVTSEMIEEMLQQVRETKISNNSCMKSILSIFTWLNNLVILRSLESVQEAINKMKAVNDNDNSRRANSMFKKPLSIHRNVSSTDDSSWAINESDGKPHYLTEEEAKFWRLLIQKYLHPIDCDEKKEQDDREALAGFRNKMAFGFFFLNALWLTVMSAMTEVKHILHIQFGRVIIEPMGFIFLVIFTVLLIMQFIGMLIHRYSTFLHIISATKLVQKSKSEVTLQQIVDLLKNPGMGEKVDEIILNENVSNDNIEKDLHFENGKMAKVDSGNLMPPRNFRRRNKETLDLRRTLRIKTIQQFSKCDGIHHKSSFYQV